MMGVPGDMLAGAGESQIVAPDGTVVARGPREGEAVVTADIDLGPLRQSPDPTAPTRGPCVDPTCTARSRRRRRRSTTTRAPISSGPPR